MLRYEKKKACAHCNWSKKFELSRSQGMSLLAVAVTNLFQVVPAWKSACGEREHEYGWTALN